MSDSESPDALVRRVRELIANGVAIPEAWSVADMELAISRWPIEWENELEVLIGGDFVRPTADLTFDALGITVFHSPLAESVFNRALSVVRCRITVEERSLSGYNDAIRRLNILLGSQAIASWGASGLAWWCAIWGIVRSARAEQFGRDADRLSEQIARLAPAVREKVEAALYWLREPRSHLGEATRPDTVRAFASYWTAFECLVSAGCELSPMPKTSEGALEAEVEKIAASKEASIDTDALRRAYRLTTPSLPERARHVFSELMPDAASKLSAECFTGTPSERRLYAIRNRISHGGTKPEDLDALALLAPAEARLRQVVWALLNAILGAG